MASVLSCATGPRCAGREGQLCGGAPAGVCVCIFVLVMVHVMLSCVTGPRCARREKDSCAVEHLQVRVCACDGM